VTVDPAAASEEWDGPAVPAQSEAAGRFRPDRAWCPHRANVRDRVRAV